MIPDDIFTRYFIAGYKTAAEWSTPADEDAASEFLDGLGLEWSAEAEQTADALCRQFITANAVDLLEAEARGRPADHLGHDLWLTAAGHGAGFWDRQELEAGGLGQRLTDACKHKPYAYKDLYAGDDGKLYLS